MGEGPKMEMMYFQDFTYQEVERTKKFLRDQWLGEILEIYKVITSFQIDLRQILIEYNLLKTANTLQYVHNCIQVCTKKKQLPAPDTRTAASFLRCLAVQMTLNVQSLTLSSMKDFDKFVLSLDEEVKHQPAGMQLSNCE